MHTREQSADMNIVGVITQGVPKTHASSIIDHTTLVSKAKRDVTCFKQYIIGIVCIQYRNDFIISLRTRTHSRECVTYEHTHTCAISGRVCVCEWRLRMFTTALWPAVDHFCALLRHHSLQYQFPRLYMQSILLALTFLFGITALFSELVTIIAHFTSRPLLN